MYMQMDNQLTPSQRYRLILSGPLVENITLPMMLEAATKDYWELEQFYEEETRTITFKILCTDDPEWQYDEMQLEEWIGIIRYHNTLFPDKQYHVKAYIECFTIDEAEEQKQCVRRSMEWFLGIASLLERDELSIVVAPPHPEADPAQFEQWAQWSTVYNEHAHEVDLMEYSEVSAPIFV